MKRVDPVVNEAEFVVGMPVNWLVVPPVIELMCTAVGG